MMICDKCGTARKDFCQICNLGMCCCSLPFYDFEGRFSRTPERLIAHETELGIRRTVYLLFQPDGTAKEFIGAYSTSLMAMNAAYQNVKASGQPLEIVKWILDEGKAV